jgi:hypothetical protein
MTLIFIFLQKQPKQLVRMPGLHSQTGQYHFKINAYSSNINSHFIRRLAETTLLNVLRIKQRTKQVSN